MGSKQRREREKESLRREILDAARDLFVKEGYENVSMRRIAEKIDYSPTTIYLYFEDKGDLLFQVSEETFSKLASKSESLLAEMIDPVVTLKKIERAYVDFGLKYPNHYKVTFINRPELRDMSKYYEKSMGQKAFNLLQQCVAECVRRKKFRRVDVEAASQALWASVHGITALLITHPKFPWTDKNKLIDLVIDTMIDGFKP
ncbi:MAG: TetR/AcrR family transcriptional regulator [Blastocatellia bacterium AA13]|nr:MAG: TetR/AcrR family transcriptional regulator [Blastocatellia bacterium AA13]